MKNLSIIADNAREDFEIKTTIRDKALAQTRQLTRLAANAIRAIHRNEYDTAQEYLTQAQSMVESLHSDLADYPDLYHAGYTQDAIKEYCEARNTYALVRGYDLPLPEEMGVEYATYLNGLAEAATELRRRCLDILRQGYSQEAETMLSHMDDIFGVLVTIDFPDAITHGLRRQTDILRSVLERTRGDLTTSLREERLQNAMKDLSNLLNSNEDNSSV